MFVACSVLSVSPAGCWRNTITLCPRFRGLCVAGWGTSVGSGAIKLSRAVLIGGLMDWLGATLLGSGMCSELVLDFGDDVGRAAAAQQLTAELMHRCIGYNTESFGS